MPPADSDLILASLVQLQSQDHEVILNVIDQLRLEGLSQYINLPQLIVCGDQSSGKSSVLDALSDLKFPAKDNVCTRFAIELILRKAPESAVTASIRADNDRPTVERERMKQFRSSTVDLLHFATIVEETASFIGVGREGNMFSKDVLRVEVTGPNQPDLTLVDLPGLYHAPDESQSAEGINFVESLVLSYLRNKRSVILAVISAKSELPLQKVTAFTRKIDPRGERTMGIITKPDTLPPDSDMEQSFLDLALNKRVNFRLGWHVLKNREHHERHFSLDQRHESEAKFFTSRIWATLPRSQVGIESLRPRLSTVLREHILHQLPGLIAEASESCEDTEARLSMLGEPRDTLIDQQRYLLQSSERFSVLINNAIDGIYFNPFFGDAMQNEGYERRLRAVVQNCLSDFSVLLEEKGMQREILDDTESIENKSTQIHYSKFVDEVSQRMRRSRGRELPGTFNPLIIGDLFYLQSRPWESMATVCVDKLLQAVQKTMTPMVRAILDERSSERLIDTVINPSLDKIEVSLRMKTDELLNPQKLGHPITYNHYFTETVQKTRNDHTHRSVTEKLKRFFGGYYPSQENLEQRYTFKMETLIHALGTETEANMERFACTEAISCMQAYYKV